MADLFANLGINIANLIDQNLSVSLLPTTLTVVTPGTRGASLIDGTNPTTQDIQGRGFIDDYGDNDIDGTLIQAGDRRVLIITNSFPGQPTPKNGDRITIENATYNIVAVKRDPAAATYTCQVRG